MDQELAPFLLFTEHQTHPETPNLSLQLALGSKLTTDSSCAVLVTITRAFDSHAEPCIFEWTQHSEAATFLLFRHTPDGLRKIKIDGHPSPAPQAPILVDGWNWSLQELLPGAKTGFMATLPKRYRTKLVGGEKYELVWPGGEVDIWDWGTKVQHLGQELVVKLPKIWLPAARATIEFNKFGQETNGRGSPPPIAISERIPGAPILSVTLECDHNVSRAGGAHVKISVLYNATAGSPAITFHNRPFVSWYSPREGYRLYCRRENDWVTYEDDITGFMIVDDPDVIVKVGQDENFTSLQAGETWTISLRLRGQGNGGLPDDVSVGDVFRYVLKGVELDWWDWGDSSDHAETVVKLPCFIKGCVVDPKDNGGRPKLIVPASNTIEFTIV